MHKNLNIIICGIGGQGVIILTRILANAALLENYDVKTSELHGLAQRGGSVETHVRFGKKIYSPLIMPNQVDLIIDLTKPKKEFEKSALNGIFMLGYYCNKKIIPLKPSSILKAIKKIVPEKYFKINKKIFKSACRLDNCTQ
ncbi:MAG: 2-oxoacid:acceptor oxidoreductase family protein [bacterium]